MTKFCRTALLCAAICGSAQAAPDCGDASVLSQLKSEYANPAPGSLFPRRPPLDMLVTPLEVAVAEGDRNGRYADFRYCQVEAADAAGRRVALRYVLKGKDWEFIQGHDMAWCAADIQPEPGPGGVVEWTFNGPECRALSWPDAMAPKPEM